MPSRKPQRAATRRSASWRCRRTLQSALWRCSRTRRAMTMWCLDWTRSIRTPLGGNNIAVGTNAGYALTNGSNNIDIGNRGVAGEGATIRIGTAGTQTATYIAGITTAHVTGSPVYVTSSGQLGVLASSERYKTDISSINDEAARLKQLRP